MQNWLLKGVVDCVKGGSGGLAPRESNNKINLRCWRSVVLPGVLDEELEQELSSYYVNEVKSTLIVL